MERKKSSECSVKEIKRKIKKSSDEKEVLDGLKLMKLFK